MVCVITSFYLRDGREQAFLADFCKKLKFVEYVQKITAPADISCPTRGGLAYVFRILCRAGALSERRGLLFQLGDEGGELFGAFLLGLDHVLRGLGQEAGVLELVVELI